MTDDNGIRRALQAYSDGDVGHPDLEAIRGGRRSSSRRPALERLLAVAVVLAIAIGGLVLVTQTWGGAERDQPVQPTPSPSASPTPTPQPTPTPTPVATGFPVSPGAGVNPGPVGGVGDTIAGLRLDDVQITSARCPGGVDCPGTFEFTLTNTSQTTGRWDVLAYTYRNSVATLGNMTVIELAPGETGVATVQMDITQAPDDGRAGSYSWNWSAEILAE